MMILSLSYSELDINIWVSLIFLGIRKYKNLSFFIIIAIIIFLMILHYTILYILCQSGVGLRRK